MRKFLFLILIPLSACVSGQKEEVSELVYPRAPKTMVTDNYFGREVQDPYRWMEGKISDSLKDWIDAENKLFNDYISKIEITDTIKEDLRKMYDFTRYANVFTAGEYLFYFRNEGLEDQSPLYIEPAKGEPRVFIDVNKLSETGTVSLSGHSVSGDKKHLAYSLSSSGSDWQEIRVKTIPSGEDLEDHIRWVKFSGISWYEDGFFYSRYPQPDSINAYTTANKYHKVYYHRLGDPQSKDRLIWEDKNHPFRNFYTKVTEDERYLIIFQSEGAGGKNAFFIQDLRSKDEKFINVVDSFYADFSVEGNIGDRLLVKTNAGAPNYRIVWIDPENPAPENWQQVAGKNDLVIKSADIAAGRILVHYMKDATSVGEVLTLEGEHVHDVNFPGRGTVSGFGGKKEDSVIYYSFTSFTIPGMVYRYDPENNMSAPFRETGLNFDPENYITEQVFYQSKDGTSVPMFLVYRKDVDPKTNLPALLYGYGGFNISITPFFRLEHLYFIEEGGILAVPNLRGGGEYGEKWHEAGMKEKKQNVFDDFISAAEFLIQNNYTSPSRLAVSGRSNGGLLVGAAITQRPDLFRAALPAVGVMDMLRFHKFTIGWAWTGEYGSSENEEEFNTLIKYSPYHNIEKDICYPATLVTTADHDDRVVPAHSFKFAARLQENQGCENPVFIRIDTKAGHGSGKPVSKIIEESAEILAFLFDRLG